MDWGKLGFHYNNLCKIVALQNLLKSSRQALVAIQLDFLDRPKMGDSPKLGDLAQS